MLIFLKNLKQKHAPKGSFGHNALTLMTGTAIAQAIPIAVAPILTRLYSPSDFGVWALFISVTSVISVIATARYELAIMLPEKDEDAVNLVALSILIAFSISFATFLIVLIFNKSITKLLGNPEISLWLYFIPVSVLLTGIFQALNYWANRKKQYRRLSMRRILQSGSTVVSQLVLGVMKIGSGGLVGGGIIGQALATGVFAREVLKDDRGKINLINAIRLKQLFIRYKSFPKYDIPASFINVLSNQLPVFLFSGFFGSAIVGFYSLTQRILSTPISFIATSILGVFKQRASEDYVQHGNCKEIYVKTLKTLAMFSIIPFVVLFINAPWLFAFIFGEKWRVAGEYTQIMAIMFFLRFIASPLSFVLYIAEKQHYEFIWQLVLLFSTAVSLLIGVFLKNVKISIILFSFSYSLMYIFYLALSYYVSKGNSKK